MSRLSKIVLISFMLFLTACSSLPGGQPTRTPLNLTHEPVKLEEVHWNVITFEDQIYYALDLQNFEALSVNMERVQGKLYLYKNTVDELIEYYE